MAFLKGAVFICRRVEDDSSHIEMTDCLLLSAIDGNTEQLVEKLAEVTPLPDKSFGTILRGIIDEKNERNVLHYAVTYLDKAVAMEMMRKIVEKVRRLDASGLPRLLNSQARNGETPLHMAVRYENEVVMGFLLANGSRNSIRAEYGKTPLDLMFEYTPSFLISTFDGAIKNRKTTSANNIVKVDKHNVDVDLTKVIGVRSTRCYSSSFRNRYSEKTVLDWEKPDTDALFHIFEGSKETVKKVLQHPLVQLFLYFKYKKMKPLFWFSFLFHVPWAMLCWTQILMMYVIRCPYVVDVDVTANSSSSFDGGVTCHLEDEGFTNTLGYIVLGTSLLLLLKEIVEFLTSPWGSPPMTYKRAARKGFLTRMRYRLFYHPIVYRIWSYFTNAENVGQLLLIISVLIATWPTYFGTLVGFQSNVIYPWQYIVVEFGGCLTGLLILAQIGKFWFGVYIEIFKTVFKNFLLFCCTFVFLWLSFLLSFMVVMPQNNVITSFGIGGLVKIFVMMTGEYSYEEMFSDAENGGKMHFPIVGKVLLLLFIGMVTITLFNVLIGVNVTNIQELTENAEVTHLAAALMRIHQMECFISKCFRTERFRSLGIWWSELGKKWFLLYPSSCYEGSCYNLGNFKEGKENYIVSLDDIKDNMWLLEESRRSALRDRLYAVCRSSTSKKKTAGLKQQ